MRHLISILVLVSRETATTLTLMVSTAPRPPGTSFSVIQLGGESNCGDEAAGGDAHNSSRGMTFEMKQGLVQLTKVRPCYEFNVHIVLELHFLLTLMFI